MVKSFVFSFVVVVWVYHITSNPIAALFVWLVLGLFYIRGVYNVSAIR